MIKLAYKQNFEKKYIDLQGFFPMFQQSKTNALGICGAFLMKKVRNYIETEGIGSWEKTHPLTYAKKKETAFFWLGKMTRYKVDNKGNKLEIGFGAFSQRDVKKGKPVKLDSKLSKISSVMQKGRSFKLTKSMRRKFGSGRKNKYSRPGIDFFPVRNATKTLEIPVRPVMKPVLQENKFKVEQIFEKRFNYMLDRRFDKL